MATQYGTSSTDVVKDQVIAAMAALLALMTSEGHSPTFTYVYTQHVLAIMKLNAVSVEIDAVDTEVEGTGQASGESTGVAYYMDISIRVHTGYEGDVVNERTNQRLMNSVDSYLQIHLQDSTANYQILQLTSFRSTETFSDSHTCGGELTYRLRKMIDHTQA